MRISMNSLHLCSLIAALLVLTAGPAASARADISQVVMVANRDYTNGVSPGLPYSQMIEVTGSGVTGVDVTKPGAVAPFSLDFRNGSWHLESDGYATLTALRADYPTGDYQFTFHYASPTPDDTVSLLFDADEPTGDVQFVSPTYPVHGATNVPYSPVPTVTWDSVAGSGWMALGCELRKYQGNNVDSAQPYDIGYTEWTPQPEVGRLEPGAQYRLRLALYQKGSMGFNGKTTGGDDFTYYGVLGHTNETKFTTAPEPGTLVLLAAAVGTAWLLRRRRGMRENA
jgi:hypothetical protein